MDKMIKKLMVAGLACVAMCGTAMAAPKGGNAPQVSPSPIGEPARGGYAGCGRAPAARQVVQQAPRSEHKANGAAPARNGRDERHESKQVAKNDRREPQGARHDEPRRDNRREDRRARHGSTLHTEDWVEIGAGMVGGLIGGLIAAS